MPVIEGLYYFVRGIENTSRPPVILIHGAGGFHLSWPPQVRRLGGLRVYAVDLPGHGKSEGTGRQSIQAYADDVAAFMKALEIHSAVIAGHSMGSGIAMTLALNYPQNVAGLVSIGGGAKLRVAPAILEGVSKPDTFVSTIQLINDYSFSPRVSQRVKELSTQRMAGTTPQVLHGDFLACDTFNAMDQLGQIKAPALIICGAEDRMTPLKFSESLRDGIADSCLEVVEGAGHMLMLEQPDLTADLISRFMKDLPLHAGR